MSNWVYIIISLCLLLLGYLLWNELRRPNKARLLWRIIATVLAVTSLAAMVLPIHYHTARSINIVQEAILLTEGFDADSLTQFLRTKKSDYPIFSFDETLVSAKRFHPTVITTADSLQAKRFSTIHIFGYGLEKQSLESLQQEQLVLHPTDIKAGITAIHWQPVVTAGSKWYVQGTFVNATATTLTLSLTAFGITLDSVIIPANKKQVFQLTTVPKQLGRMLYSIAATNGTDTLEKNPLPLTVQQGEPLKLLLLASSPDFENKFLKNHLAQKGNAVAVRTSISKNKFENEYANLQAFNSNTINANVLNRFDVVIADALALNNLSKEELSAIQTAVKQNAMGLVVRTDTADARATFYNAAFPLNTIIPATKETMQLYLPDTTDQLKPLIMEAPVFMRQQLGTQALVRDKADRVFVSSTLYGAGKILFSSLSNTYSWVLGGNQRSYEAVWATIINKAVRKKPAEEIWAVSPSLPAVNQPAQVQLQNNTTGIPQATVAGAAVYLSNNTALPFEWYGHFWPVKQGWQTGVMLNGKIYYWYAYENNDWKNLRANNMLSDTREYLLQKQLGSTNAVQPLEKETEQSFPAIYLFLIFLAASAYLWAENKYDNA